MKSKDLALIVIAVILGVIFSEVVSKFVFTTSKTGQQVEVVPSISGYFPNPSSQYFNPNAIDSTQFISIGNNANASPFGNSNQ